MIPRVLIVDDRPNFRHAARELLLVSADEPRACPARVRECGARGFLLKPRLVDADLGAFWPPRGG